MSASIKLLITNAMRVTTNIFYFQYEHIDIRENRKRSNYEYLCNLSIQKNKFIAYIHKQIISNIILVQNIGTALL